MRSILTVFVAVTAATGCASLDRIAHREMAPRLAYQGFSFDRPPNDHWYILRSEEEYTSVRVRRDLLPASPTHTFYAAVALGGLDSQPGTHAEFAELARSKGRTAPYEISEVSYHQELTTKQGQWCIRVESIDTVRGAPVAPQQELTMVIHGFRCLHPAFPKTTLDFFYSERGVAAELDPTLYEEGETFLRGVRIDVAPNTPAAQQGVSGLLPQADSSLDGLGAEGPTAVVSPASVGGALGLRAMMESRARGANR